MKPEYEFLLTLRNLFKQFKSHHKKFGSESLGGAWQPTDSNAIEGVPLDGKKQPKSPRR
jgi:hypothetical protein